MGLVEAEETKPIKKKSLVEDEKPVKKTSPAKRRGRPASTKPEVVEKTTKKAASTKSEIVEKTTNKTTPKKEDSAKMEEQLKKDVEIVLHKLQNTPMGTRIAKKQIVDLLK